MVPHFRILFRTMPKYPAHQRSEAVLLYSDPSLVTEGDLVESSGHFKKQAVYWLKLLGICCWTKDNAFWTRARLRKAPQGPPTPTFGWIQLYTQIAVGIGSQRKLQWPEPGRACCPMLIHSWEQRPSKLHWAGLEMEGLYAGFQGDDSDAVTIETVATIYCPSPLDRKARGVWFDGEGNKKSWI